MIKHETDSQSQWRTRYAPWQKAQGSSLTGPLWRRKWLFLLVFGLCVLAGAAYTITAKPSFLSTVKLHIQPATVHSAGEAAAPGLTANFLNTQCELLKSRAVVEAALAKPGMEDLSFLRSQDDPVETLGKSVDARVGRKHDIILVSVESSNAQESARAANALVESYDDYLAKQQRSMAGEILSVLGREKVLRDQELSEAKTALVEFKQANGDVTFDSDKTNVVLQRLAGLTEALTSAEIESLHARTVYEAAKIAAADAETLRQFCSVYHSQAKLPVAQNEQSELRGQLGRFELELADLRQQCTDDHPSIKNMRAKIEELRSKILRQDQQLTDAVLTALRQLCDSAQKAEIAIRQSLEGQRKLAAQFNVKTCDYAMLQSRFQRADALCTVIDSRIKELRPSENATPVAVSVIEPARAADSPQSPATARTLFSCAFIGLVLGLAAAFLRDRTDDRLVHPKEIMRCLEGCILGAVPAESADGDTDTFAADSFADSYTTLSAALQYRMDCQQGKIVLVTSALRAEGKSALAAGLAAAAARSGRTTVLVDAAGPSAVQHDLFKAPCGQGLCGVLERKVSLLEAVQKTGIEDLDILTVGMGKDQLARRLSDKSVGTMLGLLAQRYDCVIVDSSCVLAGGSARLVAQHCDCVLLALAEGKSSVKAVSRSVGSLQSVGANILGVVITHAQSAWAYDDALASLNLQGASEPVRSNQTLVQKAPSL